MRLTKSALLEKHGVSMTLLEVADLCGLKESTLKHRISNPTNEKYEQLRGCKLPTNSGMFWTEKVVEVLS